MNRPLRVFVDSDVVISSLISEKGAAYFLLTKSHENTQYFISNISNKELNSVIKRLNLKKDVYVILRKSALNMVNLKLKIEEMKKQYKNYVIDINDAHIIYGAIISHAKFLLTYNLKHYNQNKIKNDYSLIIMTPARFLQYLRAT